MLIGKAGAATTSTGTADTADMILGGMNRTAGLMGQVEVPPDA